MAGTGHGGDGPQFGAEFDFQSFIIHTANYKPERL